MEEFIHSRFNYWIYVILMMIGLWGMISKNNLIKKLIGMSIFQTAIILFYVSIAVKSETSNIPILPHHGKHFSPTEALAHADSPDYDKEDHDDHNGHRTNVETPKIPDPDGYANPLPHVLMLTAIVVGVATLGLALAITQKIYREYGTLEEDELLEKVRADDHD